MDSHLPAHTNRAKLCHVRSNVFLVHVDEVAGFTSAMLAQIRLLIVHTSSCEPFLVTKCVLDVSGATVAASARPVRCPCPSTLPSGIQSHRLQHKTDAKEDSVYHAFMHT